MAPPERELGHIVILAQDQASWVGPDGRSRTPNAGQTRKVSEEGDIYHYLMWSDGKGNIHNESGPGVVIFSMDDYRVPKVVQVQYYYNDVIHRTDGPAMVHADEHGVHMEYYQNGTLHRPDGPAVVSSEGDQLWYMDGLLHRRDGPAIIKANGDRYWAHKGYLHRDDGPAIIDANTGEKLYYRHGSQFFPDRMPETDLNIDWGGRNIKKLSTYDFPAKDDLLVRQPYEQNLAHYMANDSTYQPSDDMAVDLRTGKALYIASEWEDDYSVPFTHRRRRIRREDNPPVGGINIEYRH